jgi:hypothetical protein
MITILPNDVVSGVVRYSRNALSSSRSKTKRAAVADWPPFP